VTSLRSTSPTTTSIEGGVAVASGQIKISNAYGSELLPLTLTATAQFYSSSGWATSSTDSLTPFSTSSIISNVVSGLSGSTIAGTVVTDTCANTVFCKGVKNFTLTNSAKIPGITDICINSPGYLLHGAVLCAPSTAGVTNSGRATFGVYKGNNSIIYMRENY
jgi:MSHA biogenesis protein MshQ